MKKYIALSALCLSLNLFAQPISFDLKAKVFDYGQNVTAVELKTADKNLRNIKLATTDFKVQAKSTLPISVGENKVFGEFDTERKVLKASVNPQGNIVLLLESGQQTSGANTLAYVAGEVARNVKLDLRYQIQQQRDLGSLKADTVYQQAAIIDDEVDKFIAKTSSEKINYQFFSPQNTQTKRPLIVWLHGNGEGGYEEYQNNQSQLLANRGGAAFVSGQTQQIFGGAYVIAPQSPDTWYNNYNKGYIEKIKHLIDEVVAENEIDTDRIYLFGASAGGYMALRMLVEYPDYFASLNVSAPALDRAVKFGGAETTAADLEKIKHKPIWLVHAVNDPTISYTDTSKRVFLQLRDNGAILTAYPEVKIGQSSYNGHWSWIYSLRNMPVNPQGQNLFQWVAQQRLTQQ